MILFTIKQLRGQTRQKKEQKIFKQFILQTALKIYPNCGHIIFYAHIEVRLLYWNRSWSVFVSTSSAQAKCRAHIWKWRLLCSQPFSTQFLFLETCKCLPVYHVTNDKIDCVHDSSEEILQKRKELLHETFFLSGTSLIGKKAAWFHSLWNVFMRVVEHSHKKYGKRSSNS